MKIVIVSPDHDGHLNPLINLAKILVNLNHDITFYVSEKNENKLKDEKRIKLKIFRYDEKDNEKREEKFSGIKYSLILIMNRSLDSLLNELIKNKEDKYDMLIYDPFIDGEVIAKLLNIPKSIASYSYNRRSYSEMASQSKSNVFEYEKLLKRKLGKKYGINIRTFFENSSDFKIPDTSIFHFSKELQDKSEDFAGNCYFIGPTLDFNRFPNISFDFTKKKEQKLIYISLGTLFNDDNSLIINKAIEAFINYPNVQVIVSIGKNKDINTYKQIAAENIYIYNYVPQIKVLEMTDIFITHAGFNSIIEALFINNIPLILVPQSADHFHNARLITSKGCGITIFNNEFTSEKVKIAYEKMINEKSYKINSTKLGDSLRKANENKIEILKKLLLK